MTVVAILLLACNGKRTKAPVGDIFDEANIPAAEKLIIAAMEDYDTDRITALTDSLLKTGDISAVAANYYHAVAASNQGDLKAVEAFLKEATANREPSTEDMRAYLKSSIFLARILLVGGDYETTLAEALPTLALMDSLGYNTNFKDMAQLTCAIGSCQQYLHFPSEAAASFEKAYNYLSQWIEADTTGKEMPRIIALIDNISNSYLNTSQFAEAKTWLDRENDALVLYNAKPAVVARRYDMFKGANLLGQARVAWHLGKNYESALYYNEFLNTDFSKSGVGRINAVDYLLPAGRHAEAADNYGILDHVMSEYKMDLSLDNIGHYLLPKLRVNILTGRRDSAFAVGMKIIECYDSALSRQKQDAAAELATIYDTQGKERQIAEQQMKLSRDRVTALVVSIVALIVFFIIFTIVRHRAARRLAKVEAIKERMEGELSIARDIQMSMVPNSFPEVEGLDMYASMEPAREVGGDLYGYQLKGDKLYFAVGDVSGKGVPASLFMTQATRLFHSMAAYGFKPEVIATLMNRELTQGNEQGMFVTMFIGLIDLPTGHLDFCNAGHNAPVVGGGEHGGDFLDMKPNAPIGLWPDLEYEGEEIDSIKGRTLFIYTDGLNEAENERQEQLGDERLLELLRATRFENARQVIDTLAAAVDKHREGTEPNDDLTMMCIRTS
jgi:serine phosphatase RsbU (regulator of sigma subunit)